MHIDTELQLRTEVGADCLDSFDRLADNAGWVVILIVRAAQLPASKSPTIGDCLFDAVDQRRRVVLTLVMRVAVNPFADESADQVVDRLAEQLALDVPEREVG